MDERIPETLREVFARIIEEVRRGRSDQRAISHALAHGFMMTLEDEGARILWQGGGNANYFIAEIDGASVGVSPFGSHEEFWEKPSRGFCERVREIGCRWGVVLFMLPKKEGVWIEGPDFETKVLRGREKVNSSEVHQARRARIAHPFSESREFIGLIRHPPRRPGDSFLVRSKP